MAFWLEKSLAQLTSDEWESLCDGCGLCCLHKVEHEDTGEIQYSALICSLYDLDRKTCSDYPNRQQHVPDCVALTPELIDECSWLPESCGYRRVALGQDLPAWHPLKTGDRQSVHQAQAGVGCWAKKAKPAQMPEEYLLHWYDPALPMTSQWPQSKRLTGRRVGKKS